MLYGHMRAQPRVSKKGSESDVLRYEREILKKRRLEKDSEREILILKEAECVIHTRTHAHTHTCMS
jgi:hypothetical protein